MLRNPTATATTTTTTTTAIGTTEELIEHEYQKLKCAWEQQRYDSKLQKQETKYHSHNNMQFTLMHLFHGYLNQIWMDSQNMLQCAQSWDNGPHQKDAAFTMNILGLHLMKQSLKTRQELFHIVDEASHSHDTKPARASSTTSSCSIPSYFQKPVKLSSSPSTPTINNAGAMDPHWQLESATTTCKHAFTPGSNYPSYFPEELVQSTSCHFCHEKLGGLKKSFSADHFSTLASQISSEETTTSSSSDDEDSYDEVQAVYQCCNDDTSNNNSAFDLESIEEDMLASRKLLIQEDDDDEEDEGNFNYQQKLLKYQLICSSELHESSKLELEDDDDHASVSSSGTTMEELRMKRSTINNSLLHERIDSSSTCLPESVYSSDSPCHCEQEEEIMPQKKRNLSMFFVHNSKSSSTTKSSFRNKLKRYRSKKDLPSDKNPIPRSLSNTLCQLFTSQNSSNHSSGITNNKRQQAQL
ncbi:hypothetical protein MAM1_0042d02955 [Mucor ambiguus]|uniref:Uncharacterized protein n=1 Tax=Mucor ambiguus TaxID=91626 RepID=A0A0C9LT81_9FUNG|nr:hypothetical protein MAM1_0042d02955 [Mucor ambiguus]